MPHATSIHSQHATCTRKLQNDLELFIENYRVSAFIPPNCLWEKSEKSADSLKMVGENVTQM